MTAVEAPAAADLIALEDAHVAHNYHPLDVVVAEARVPWSSTRQAGNTSTSSPPTPRPISATATRSWSMPPGDSSTGSP